MSCSIRDASLTTARRRQLALYAWRKGESYPENPQSLNKEQRASYGFRQVGSTGDVPVEAYVGAQLVGQARPVAGQTSCGCNTNVTLNGDTRNSGVKS